MGLIGRATARVAPTRTPKASSRGGPRGRPQKSPDFEKWAGFHNFWAGRSWTRPYGTPSFHTVNWDLANSPFKPSPLWGEGTPVRTLEGMRGSIRILSVTFHMEMKSLFILNSCFHPKRSLAQEPLIRHGCAAPPSPHKGEGLFATLQTVRQIPICRFLPTNASVSLLTFPVPSDIVLLLKWL